MSRSRWRVTPAPTVNTSGCTWTPTLAAIRTEPPSLPNTTDRCPCAIHRNFSVTPGQWRLLFPLLKIDFGSAARTSKDQLIAFTRLRSAVRVRQRPLDRSCSGGISRRHHGSPSHGVRGLTSAVHEAGRMRGKRYMKAALLGTASPAPAAVTVSSRSEPNYAVCGIEFRWSMQRPRSTPPMVTSS